jgi:hypothetical protein
MYVSDTKAPPRRITGPRWLTIDTIEYADADTAPR